MDPIILSELQANSITATGRVLAEACAFTLEHMNRWCDRDYRCDTCRLAQAVCWAPGAFKAIAQHFREAGIRA